MYGDPALRETSEKIEDINQDVKDLVSDLWDTLKKARGLGLAAVQIGVLKRVFIVDFSSVDLHESLKVFINPEILDKSGDIEMEEGCLSFPGIYQKITRALRVRVRATDIEGKEFELSLEGITARAVLHEYDHLEGKLFIDHISPIARSLLKGKLKQLSVAS